MHFEKQFRDQNNSPGPGRYGEIEPKVMDSVRESINLKSVLASARRSTQDESDIRSILETARSRTSCSTAIRTSRNIAMAKVGKSLASTIRTDRGYSFGDAQDRFRVPTMKVTSPSPNMYRIDNNFSLGIEKGFNSPFKK